MDKKFLIEYECREKEQFEKYTSISDRIPNLISPVFNLTSPCPSIWSQIAFSGTIIFPLQPMDQTTFEKIYNISADDIPDLVKFVKETKKIQFFLSEPPTLFAGHDYLDPIFEEIAPPLYALNREYQNTAMQQSFDNSEEELGFLVEIVVSGIQDPSIRRHFYEDYIREYAFLKHFGFTDICDIFYNTLIYNPDVATNYIELAYSLLAHPIIDPLKANSAIPLEMIQGAKSLNLSSVINPKNIIVPEVGNFLLKKTTQYPDSLEACKCVISQYKRNDLYSVYSALNEAIVERNPTEIISNKNELEEILDNIWEDSVIGENKTAYKAGLDVICGTVGISIGSLGGLIGAAVGGAAAAACSPVLDNYAELIAKKIARPHMATIYDFQKKYPVTK